jgi:hypothetical protein
MEGLADVRFIKAIYQSAGTGKGVELPPPAKEKGPAPAQEIHRWPQGKPKIVNAKCPSGD